jgi:hypothetical protein
MARLPATLQITNFDIIMIEILRQHISSRPGNDIDMNETTRDIVTEGTWRSELLSFGSGNPATENIRTVEPM